MTHFLAPVLALVIWSLIVAIILYIRRIPAMRAARMHPEKAKTPDGEWKRQLPLPAQYASHNYSHLMESPTLFYVLMFAIFLMGLASHILSLLGWGFVILRVIHSLIQLSGGKVMHRFSVFSLSILLLIVMSVLTVVGLVTSYNNLAI